jgi:hypothetical protein
MNPTRILGLVAASLLLAMPFAIADPTPGRAAGKIEINPEPLCGESGQTGFNWHSVTASVGRADWQVYLWYSYTTTGGASGSGSGVRYFSSDTNNPNPQTGVPRCGYWTDCSAYVELSWWNGADWVYVDGASTFCV